jgi:hypothetical protein
LNRTIAILICGLFTLITLQNHDWIWTVVFAAGLIAGLLAPE